MTAGSGHSHRLGRVVLTIALLLPFLPLAGTSLAGSGGRGWVWGRGHVLLLMVVLAAYELGVLAAGVVVQARGELRKRWSDGFLEAIEAALRRRFSPYGRRYRRFLVEAHRDVDLRGPLNRLPLDEVFVPPSIEGIWERLRETPGRVLPVVGEPGAGKTTLLKHLTLTMARNRRAGWPVGAPRHKTPILLSLRDHAAAISADPSIPLAELARRTARPLRAGEPLRWFDQQIDTGRCVVLLDGLDEVGDDRMRGMVLRWADQQAATHRRCRFMLTSRLPYGPGDGLSLPPLTAEQTLRFARSWHRAVERRLAGRDDVAVQRRAEEGAAQLVWALAQSPEIEGNPLLLAMAANVRRFGGPVPLVRKELYAETCKVLLTPRGRLDKVIPALSVGAAERVLGVLAAAMTESGITEVPAVEAADIVAPSLVERRPQLDPQDFLSWTARYSGLLLERPGGFYRFAHLTLQDHLSGMDDQAGE